MTGGVNDIRHKDGNNNIELIYTGDKALEPMEGVFSVLSDIDNAGRHTAVVSLENDLSSNAVLAAVLSQDLQVNSFKELIPRMNDIFIKLVTEGE
jgi:ABC-2 type transport system ATP-binding protein